MKEYLKNDDPSTENSIIKELEGELNKRDAQIELLNEKLSNNKDILQNVISEKKQLKVRIQEYDLKLIDAKLSQFQKLQVEHQKTVHRLQVTKKHLDSANKKINELQLSIEDLEKIIEDLDNRGLWDHLRGKYPESYQKYKK